MNLTSNDRFKCEFTMMDHMVLSDVLTIDFEGKPFLVRMDMILRYAYIANPWTVWMTLFKIL